MKRITLVKEAAYMAISAHGAKKYGDYPYYFHVEQVVDILIEYGYTEDKYVIAGYLHDTIEDTDVSYNDIKNKFGETIAEMVYCVSDLDGRNRKEKKAITLPRTASNPDSIIIKLADRIANLRKGGKKGMYVDEYKVFKDMLYTPGHEDGMWKELDELVK